MFLFHLVMGVACKKLQRKGKLYATIFGNDIFVRTRTETFENQR